MRLTSLVGLFVLCAAAGTAAAQPVLAFTPPALNVGVADVGNPVTNVIVFDNNGNQFLDLASVRIIGTNATDFSFTDHNCSGQGPCVPGPSTVFPGGGEDFVIRCIPSATGPRSATLEVVSSDPAGTRTAMLTCTGRSPEVTVAPLMVPFGNVRVGQASPLGFTISNSSGAQVSFLSYSVTETIPDVTVACVPSCSGMIAPGGMATVTVTFAPTSTGLRMGNVVVMTNDLDEAVVNVAMSGVGVESNLSSPPSVTFGNVPVAQTAGSVVPLAITNMGGASLNTTTMTITGDPSFSFAFPSGLCTTGATCNQVVTAGPLGGTANIPLRCDPSSAGLKMATLNIQSDDPSPVGGTNVALTCTGTVSAMTVMPPTLTYANQRINTNSIAQGIMVLNTTGTAPLNYTVTAPAGGQFLVTVGAVSCTPFCNGLSVPAGGSATVNVVFRPTSTGLKNGTVIIDDTDNFSTDASVAVSGTGVEPVATLTSGPTVGFGDVVNGTTSPPRTITVQNTGTMDLTISSVTETDAADNFDLTGPSGLTTLPMGQAQSWMVTCDPETQGAKTGTITINNNSTSAPAIAVALTCTSLQGLLIPTAAPVPITTTTINFGPVALATMRTTTVTLTNPGNAAVTVSSIDIAPTTEGFTRGTITPDATVPAGGTRTFTVTFAPTLDSQGAASLTVDSDWNDPVISLVGDGEPVGFSCTPNPAMLGNVPWDSTQAQVITLRNTGTASVNVQSVAFLSGDTGEFAAIPAGTGAGTLNMNQMRTFNITAVPTDVMLGARAAVLRITTDLPPGMGQFCDVPVSYTSTGPAVTLTPGMTVDFGGVDIDAGPRTMQLELANSGDGRMTIVSVGALAPPFSRTDFAGLTIEPSASQTLAITYDPAVERDAANPDSQTFTIATGGLYAGGAQQPPNIQVTVRGFGVDRHIAVADVSFPGTYRNPTDAQVPTVTCGAGGDQPCAVRVCNSGGAPLIVDMLSDESDVFVLAETADIEVGGGTVAAPTCHDVAVAFRPTGYAPFTAMVTVMNDDNANPMAMVMLSGQGVEREVVVPATFDLEDVPVDDLDLSELALMLTNSSGGTFAVRELRLMRSGAPIEFRLGSGGASLPPGTHALDGTLHISRAGAINEVVEVYLDGDPERHAAITITGTAVEKENYYSCSSGRSGRATGAALLFAVALILRRRRATGGRAARATARP